MIAQDKEVARIFVIGLSDLEALDDYERMQFFFLFAMLVGLVDQTFADYCLKIVDEEILTTGGYSIARMLQTRGGRAFWRTNSGSYVKAFRDYIEATVYTDSK